jgi:hypothetical protein
MFTLLFIGIFATVVAAAVMVYAVATAQEGFEDSLGFHALERDESSSDVSHAGGSTPKSSERELPPLAAAR